MVHPEEIVGIVGSFVTVSMIVWTAAKVYLRKLELTHGAARPQVDGAVVQRLERIEQAVEAIAIEMERVSEGQRFTTKLLTERASERAPALRAPQAGVAPRTDTPH